MNISYMKLLPLAFIFTHSLSISFAQNSPQVIKRPDSTVHAKTINDSNYIFTIVQKMPVYPGDADKFISSHLKYPETERKKGIEGTVYITFVVEKNGTISNVRLLRGVPNGPALAAEAIRVVSMMNNWTPGMQNGVPVRVQYNIPIRFVLK